MPLIFTSDSPYKKRARFLAVLWTLLIFVGCLMPAKNVPHVQVPLADKWVHFIFFGGFSFLWLCTRPSARLVNLCLVLALAVAYGTVIEVLQGVFTSLGRSSEVMDLVADSIGGVLGVLVFLTGVRFSRKNSFTQSR